MATVLMTGSAVLAAEAGGPGASLAGGFASPPASARPWVYWSWLNGNVNTQQITADLEAMRGRGIGGAMNFHVSEEAGYGAPTYGSGPVYPGGSAVPMGVEFMTGPWRELFKHAVREAHRLGIEIGLMASSGYSFGGPWITPEQAGRRVVWSETNVTGPLKFSAVVSSAAWACRISFRPPGVTFTKCVRR